MRTSLRGRRTSPVARRDQESGYVAVLMSIMMLLLFSMAAFAVDVGNWYLTGQKLQKAADAGALAGVPYLPATPAQAFTVAGDNVANNGFIASGHVGAGETMNATLDTRLAGSPTRLRVTVGTTVSNVFGNLLGVSKTTIVRTSVADYSGPVPLGSPCNKFGNDPDPGPTTPGQQCAKVTGGFWANVGSLNTPKNYGDAFQNNYCAPAADGSVVDNCTAIGGTNTDYAVDGYFYSVTLSKPVNNLVLEAFDPAFVAVGDRCETSSLMGASAVQNTATNNWALRYAPGLNAFCTGDIQHSDVGRPLTTQFTVRQAIGTSNSQDPLSYPVVSTATCGQKTYDGYDGDLATALDGASPRYDAEVARVFRNWVSLCTIPYAPAVQYLIHVKTNGLGNDVAPSSHNRFSLRAHSPTDATAAHSIGIAGLSKMAMMTNAPSSLTQFHLARLSSGAASKTFTVNLFDIGDSSQPGTIQLKAPEGSGVEFTDCRGSRPGVSVTNCSFPVTNILFDGKWQTIELDVPADYTCDDLDPNACWVTLEYDYGVGSAPNDTTSWTASLQGDPVRLIE